MRGPPSAAAAGGGDAAPSRDGVGGREGAKNAEASYCLRRKDPPLTPFRRLPPRARTRTALGWSPHPRVRASRGQRNAVAASHSSCLPTLALLLLLLLRPVKATRCTGARRRWSPSRTWGLVIRCSRQLLRKMSQRSKRTRRLVAPSPSCPDASPSHGPSLRTARANDAPSGGPVVIARQGQPALLEPFHTQGCARAGLASSQYYSGDHSDGHGMQGSRRQGQVQQLLRSRCRVDQRGEHLKPVANLETRDHPGVEAACGRPAVLLPGIDSHTGRRPCLEVERNRA